MTGSSSNGHDLLYLLVVFYAAMLTLCRSIHNGVLDGFQLDFSYSRTALYIPFPATTMLGNGTFLVITGPPTHSVGDQYCFALSSSVTLHGSAT